MACHKNVKEEIAHPFWGKPVHTFEEGDHVYEKWTEPKFRCSEYKKVEKKQVEFGYWFQRRTCTLCGIVEEVRV